MRTYTIEGTDTTRKFVEKDWHPVATIKGTNKEDALKTFKKALHGSDDSHIIEVHASANEYASYRAVVA
jgi:hypothetical protein